MLQNKTTCFKIMINIFDIDATAKNKVQPLFRHLFGTHEVLSKSIVSAGPWDKFCHLVDGGTCGSKYHRITIQV